ncbi:MAG: XdhC family protein [Pseudomonadota bacterium]
MAPLSLAADSPQPDRPMHVRYLEHARDVFRFTIEERQAGRPVALLVVTDTLGGALRGEGSLLAVTGDGLMAGYVSNGCVDADVVLQAQEAIELGQPRSIRYGQGSPFLDIALPCGGAIECLVLPDPPVAALTATLTRLDARRPVRVRIARDSGVLKVSDDLAMPGDNAHFAFTALPKPRIRMAGRGAVLMATARLGIASGFEVIAATPDPDEVETLKREGAMTVHHLTSLEQPPKVEDDPWTAFLLLFHDHEWEPALLEQVLDQPAYFIGAMGSRRTHEARIMSLEAAGHSAADIARVQGPLGVVRSLRDAQLIAVSALAQVVEKLQSRQA